jgi:hypothetical protein
MKDFEWSNFKGRLLIKYGLTVKAWCVKVGFDRDRLSNIRLGRTKPTEKEVEMFNEVLED